MKPLAKIISQDPVLNRWQDQLIAALNPALANTILDIKNFRFTEGPYPTPVSPACLLIQAKIGNTWTTVQAINQNGVDLAGPHLAMSGNSNNFTGGLWTGLNITSVSGWSELPNSSHIFTPTRPNNPTKGQIKISTMFSAFASAVGCACSMAFVVNGVRIGGFPFFLNQANTHVYFAYQMAGNLANLGMTQGVPAVVVIQVLVVTAGINLIQDAQDYSTTITEELP